MTFGAEPVESAALSGNVRRRVDGPWRRKTVEPVAPRIWEMQAFGERESSRAIDLDQRGQTPQRIGFRFYRDHLPQPIEPARLRQDHREHAVFHRHA